jgi:hypothetical protein
MKKDQIKYEIDLLESALLDPGIPTEKREKIEKMKADYESQLEG